MNFKKHLVLLGATLSLFSGVSHAVDPEDFYPLYQASPTKCTVEHGDQAAKVVLDGFDIWFYGDKFREDKRKTAYRDASQAARFLKDSGCTDALMLFRWATMARVQNSEALKKEAWNTLLGSLEGLEKHYPPVLDNAYNTLEKMARTYAPERREEFYRKAIETADVKDKLPTYVNFVNFLIKNGRYADARNAINEMTQFGKQYQVDVFKIRNIQSFSAFLEAKGY